jgi:hypothetical protein
MNSLQFQWPSIKELALWGFFCFLPMVVFLVGTKDVWVESRSVLQGVLVSKSFQFAPSGYGSMLFRLRGQPYQFSAPLRIVRPASGVRPEAGYDAVKESRAAAVEVFTRDLPMNTKSMGSIVPVILVEQDGEAVFKSELLFYARLLPALLVLTLIGLLGITVSWRSAVCGPD